jgi:hypothetical protein
VTQYTSNTLFQAGTDVDYTHIYSTIVDNVNGNEYVESCEILNENTGTCINFKIRICADNISTSDESSVASTIPYNTVDDNSETYLSSDVNHSCYYTDQTHYNACVNTQNVSCCDENNISHQLHNCIALQQQVYNSG